MYASSEAITKSSRSRELGEPLVEGERRDRARRVVRVVDPDDRASVVVERVEIRQEAVLAQQRQRAHLARRRRARRARRPGRPARRTRRRACRTRGSTSTCASEKIASFEPYVGTISVSGSSSTPKRRPHQPRGGVAQLGQAGGERVGRALAAPRRRAPAGCIGSVGSFGSPLPKSITSTPCATRRRRASSRRTNGYVAMPASVGAIRTATSRRYRGTRAGSRSSARGSRPGSARRACARNAVAPGPVVDRVDALLGELRDRRPRLLRRDVGHELAQPAERAGS